MTPEITGSHIYQLVLMATRATRFWKKALNIWGSLVRNWLHIYLMVSSGPPKFLDNLCTCVLWGFLKKTTCRPVDVDSTKEAQDTITKACENPRHDILPRSETSRISGWRCPHYSRGSTDLRFTLSLYCLGAFALSRKASTSYIIRPSVRPNVSARLPTNRFPWNLVSWNFMEICQETPNLVKFGQKYRHFTWRPKYVLLLPAALNSHTSALFEGNGIRLLSLLIRREHCAKASQCYVIRTLSSAVYPRDRLYFSAAP